MKRLFYRLEDNIFIDFKALMEMASELEPSGSNNLEQLIVSNSEYAEMINKRLINVN